MAACVNPRSSAEGLLFLLIISLCRSSCPALVDSGILITRQSKTRLELLEETPFHLGIGTLKLRSPGAREATGINDARGHHEFISHADPSFARDKTVQQEERGIRGASAVFEDEAAEDARGKRSLRLGASRRASLSLRGGSGLPPGGQVVQCVYTANWDANGVFYFLGRMAANAAANSGQLPPGAQVDWLNPAMAGFVRVHCGEEGYKGYDSERWDITLAKELVLDRLTEQCRKEVPGAAFFGDGWFMVELGPNFQLRPTHYTLRNGGGTFVACMTGWVLEGSQAAEGPWHTLDYRGSSKDETPMEEHQCCVFNDLAAQHPNEAWPHDSVTFPIEEGKQILIGGEVCPTPGHNNCGFRVFRLRQLLSRMPGSTNMYIQGLELYGDLYIPPM